MPKLTTKELDSIKGQLNAEKGLISKYTYFAQISTDSEVKKMCEDFVSRHKKHYGKMCSYLDISKSDMNENFDFKDQQIAGDILTSQKHATELYNQFAVEAKMPELHSDFMEMLNQEHQMQQEIFKLMEEKGWYPIEMAEAEKIEKTKKMFEA